MQLLVSTMTSSTVAAGGLRRNGRGHALVDTCPIHWCCRSVAGVRGFTAVNLPCCAELEAQTGIAEKTLAEFIVDVAKGARNVDGFKKVHQGGLLVGNVEASSCGADIE